MAPDEETVTFMAKEFIIDVLTRFNYFALSEIEYACKCGVRGEYLKEGEDFNAISVVQMNKWIQSYNKSEARKRFIEVQKESHQLSEHVTTESEKDEYMKNACIMWFEKFRIGEQVIDGGNAKYNWLNSKGYIPFSQDRKDQIKAEAQQELINQMQLEAVGKPEKKNELLKLLDNISGMDFQGRVISLAKYKALIIFFSELLTTNGPNAIDEILNEK